MPTEKKESPATKKMPEEKKYAQHTSDDRDVHHTQMPGRKTDDTLNPNRDPMKRERTDRDDDRRR